MGLLQQRKDQNFKQANKLNWTIEHLVPRATERERERKQQGRAFQMGESALLHSWQRERERERQEGEREGKI